MKKLVPVFALFAACMMSSVWAGQIVGIQKFVVQKGTNVLSAVMFGSPDGQFLAQPLKRQLFEYRAGDTFVWTLDGKECVYRFDGAHWYDAEGKDADEVILPSLKDGIVFVREVDERSSISISGQLNSDVEDKHDELIQRQGSRVARNLSTKPSSLHRNGLLEFGRFLVFWGCIIALPMMLFARPKKGRRRTLLRYGVLTVFVSALGFMWLAPSCDRLEEAHGFIRSDGYTIGNGVLVGCEVDGKPRLAFLTCRHVVTSRMTTSNRAFGEIASADNCIFLNKLGKGFQYVGLNEIDPYRWCTVPDLWCDVAWIVLTDDEVRQIFGTGRVPSFVNISESCLNRDGGFFCVNEVGREVDMRKCPLLVYSLFSPVFGPSDDPYKQMYLKTVFPLPFSTLSFGLAMYQKPSATSSSYILLSNGPELDFYGKKMRVPMRIYDIQWSAHVNKSGSPVFATVENDADKGRALIGLVALTNDEKGEAGFISLDTAIPSIRSSLAGESAMRLFDFCARLKR